MKTTHFIANLLLVFRLCILLSLLVASLSFSTSLIAVAAATTVIGFDFFPGPDGQLGTGDDLAVSAPTIFSVQTVQLTDEYAALGVLFTPDPSLEDKNEILNNDSFSSPPGTTEPNLLASRGMGKIDGTFIVPVFSVGILVTAGADELEIFDASNNSLGALSGSNTFLSLNSAVPIGRFTVTAIGGSITPGIDNLTFEAVPEPSSIVLATLGLLSVRFSCFDRRTKAVAPPNHGYQHGVASGNKSEKPPFARHREAARI